MKNKSVTIGLLRPYPPNLPFRGKPLGTMRPAWARSPSHSASSSFDFTKVRSAGILPGQAVCHFETAGIERTAILVFLQANALAPCHFRQLIERENQQFAVLANDCQAVMAFADARAKQRLVRQLDIHHLFALAGIGDDLALGNRETITDPRYQQQSALGIMLEGRDDIGVIVHFNDHANRFAMAATAGQLVAANREELAIGGEQDDLVMAVRREGDFQLVAFLEGER